MQIIARALMHSVNSEQKGPWSFWSLQLLVLLRDESCKAWLLQRGHYVSVACLFALGLIFGVINSWSANLFWGNLITCVLKVQSCAEAVFSWLMCLNKGFLSVECPFLLNEHHPSMCSPYPFALENSRAWVSRRKWLDPFHWYGLINNLLCLMLSFLGFWDLLNRMHVKGFGKSLYNVS